jgi:Zn finger protein HypA/HybF involved in hydrogenase expression
MWIIIDDKKVRSLWECAECNTKAYVEPWFYSEMGEPICPECDGDMEYINTQIDIES